MIINLASLNTPLNNQIRLDRIVSRFSPTVELKLEDLTPSWLIKTYFFGIPLTDPRGNILSSDVFSFYIGRAIDEMETHLNIRVKIVEADEQHDFDLVNWTRYVYIQCWNRPIIDVLSLKIMVGNLEVSDIPRDWVVFNKWTGEITIIPVLPGFFNIPIEKVWTFYLPMLLQVDYMPSLILLKLKAGMEVIDKLMADVIGMIASIQVFNILGDLVIGAGIASLSISLEGLSQSIGTTASAENSAYSARIRMYQEDLKRVIPILKKRWSPPSATVI